MTRSRKLLWLTAGIVVAVVSVGSFGDLPSASEMVSGAASKEQQANALNSQAAQARAAAENADQFASTLAAAREAVPPTPELATLVSQVEQEVQATGMTWTSGAPTRTTQGDVPSWGMDMVVVGSVDQVQDLVLRLRSLPRLVVVNSLSIQQSGTEPAQTSLSISFFATEGSLESFPEEERMSIEREWAGSESGGVDNAFE